jgi:hypothetical protein
MVDGWCLSKIIKLKNITILDLKELIITSKDKRDICPDPKNKKNISFIMNLSLVLHKKSRVHGPASYTNTDDVYTLLKININFT